jgi:hypothetical protein
MRTLGDGLYTGFLFNQYDIISTIGPVVNILLLVYHLLLMNRQMVVGFVLAGIPDLKSFLHGLLWQELHLIAFEIQNQVYSTHPHDFLCFES